MEGPERVVCCTLCLCMAVAVFSSVALVYLTALVYMPAKREFQSALSDVPVMCTTVQRVETDDCGEWYSCGEWCLSKSSHCVQLWASVRKNGTDVMFTGCTDIQDITCMVLDADFVELKSCSRDQDCAALNTRFFSKCDAYDCGKSTRPFICDQSAGKCVSRRQHFNCKLDDVCTYLDETFQCENGLCQNITSMYDCAFDDRNVAAAADETYDCTDKRNCITLQGLFHCRRGRCAKIKWPWHCERRCRSVSTDVHRHNVLLLAGDRMVAANCKAAVRNKGTKEILWKASKHRHKMFMTSCTSLSSRPLLEGSAIGADDCVNGTLMPASYLPAKEANYSAIHGLFSAFGRRFPLDRSSDATKFPFENDIAIYNRTKLLINTEACVNTLRYECTDFHLDHRNDGRNYTARDRFPCFYTPTHGKFVTSRFSLEQTRHVFLLCFAIPASLWVVSCSSLIGCSKVLRVEDNGQMRIRCRRKLYDQELIIQKPRRTSSMRRQPRRGSLATKIA